MNKIYFAHPVNIYGEPLEDELAKLIANVLTGGDLFQVENPNQPCHQEGYDEYARRLKESGTDHKGMNYFYDKILPNCSGCVGVPFLDGRFGLGVAGEMRWFIEREKPVSVAHPLSGRFLIRPISVMEGIAIMSGDTKLVVSHEETRLRTWKVYNQIRRPYEEAHLVTMPVPVDFYPKG